MKKNPAFIFKAAVFFWWFIFMDFRSPAFLLTYLEILPFNGGTVDPYLWATHKESTTVSQLGFSRPVTAAEVAEAGLLTGV